MRIAYLIHSLHSPGGMEKILTSKADWLCAQPDTEVWIIYSHMRGRQPYFPLDSRIHVLDVNVNERMLGWVYRRRLQSILDDIKPDLTVSLCGSDLFQMVKCSGTGAKVAEYHFPHDKFFLKYPRRPLFARMRTKRMNDAFAGCDAVVVLSDYDLEYYRGVMPAPDKVHKIGNTVPNPLNLQSDLTRKRFLCVGRLSAEKNFTDALRIWKTVVGKCPDWHLDIYGDGSERKLLARQIGEMGLSEHVSLKGKCLDIMAEYAGCSGLLITSKYEGFGLVAIEAASCGVPVVSYASRGGLTELITDGKDGFIVGYGDTGAAADRIVSLIEDYNLRREMGEAARVKAQRYSPDCIMGQWTELFNSLIKETVK